MIALAGIVRHGHIAAVIDEVVEEHGHQNGGQGAGNAIGRSGHAHRSALLGAAHHKAVADLSADGAAHQQQDTGRTAHAQIALKVTGLVPAQKADENHCRKIDH